MSGLNLIENYLIIEERKRQTILGDIVPKFSLFGLILLILSTLGNSLCLPMCKYMHYKCASIKMVWRCIWYMVLMQPTFCYEMYKSKSKLNIIMSKHNIFTLAKVGVLIYLIVALQIVSVKFTYASHTTMLGGMPAVILIIAKLLRCVKPSINEMIGGSVAIIGAAILMMDGSGSELSAISIIIGDVIAIGSSVVYAFFMTFVGPVLDNFSLSIMITISGVFTSIAAFIAMLSHIDGAIFLSTDPQMGFLSGITDKSNLLCTFIGLGLFGAYIANMTFYAAFKYFDPIIISLTLLAVPFVTEIIVLLLGIEKLPGILTLIGGITVLIGLVFIARADTHEQK